MFRKLSFLIAVSLLVLPVAADELTLEQVIANNIEAKGGRAAMDAIKTIEANGRATVGPGMEAPIKISFKRPSMVRLEITVQGMTIIQAYDGETGWFVMPFTGSTDPEKMSDDQLKDVVEMADFDGVLVDWEKKGHEVELIGKEEIEGTEAYKLKVTLKTGDVVYYYLDAEYFLEIKSESKRTVRDQEVEVETTQGDYKEVDGLMIAHSQEVRPKGAPAGQTITIEKIELNLEVADTTFGMPEKASE